MSESNRVLKYLWLRDERRTPVACIAYTAEKGDDRIELGFSVQNPRDEVNKKLGRTIAKGRHDKTPFCFKSNGKNANELRGDVMRFLLEQENYVKLPPRLREILRQPQFEEAHKEILAMF